MGYFRVKADQERVVESGTVPWSIVRATQFHEFVATSLAAAGTGRRAPLLPLPMPGGLGRALRAGVLTAEAPDVRGATPFAAWLAAEGR